MQLRSVLALSAAAILAAATGVTTAGASSASSRHAASTSVAAPSGSFALSGQAARDFVLPPNMQKVRMSEYTDGRTWTRYQQMVGDATVFGGQITIIRSSSGVAQSVIGAHFPGLKAKNSVKLTKSQAKSAVVAKVGAEGTWRDVLRINPRTARMFYEVQSIRDAGRPVRWIDAATGATTRAFNALAHGEGIGVKGDTKTIDTTLNGGTGLYELKSGDGRQETYDLQNKSSTAGGVLMTDADDVWNFTRVLRSPSQPAGVDAHYYANVVDDFYGDTFNRDSIDDNGMTIISKVHFANHYCNAFWNGAFMTYGDGDNRNCLPLSGGLDVDSHELTHGVTEFTSNLIYQNESGALNEAFSDMMGNTTEFYADANGLDPAAEPDWLIGEDIFAPDSATPGFRNMGDPEQFGDPSHYSRLFTGTADNGGVHTNSGIANHAYYLTVNGGSNASCTANAFHGVLLTGPDCAVVVPALGLGRTQHIFYDGFTSLPEFANFCDARNGTIAVAGDDAASIGLTWDAVGVHDGCTPAAPPPPPCVGDPDAQLPIESPHPYGNMGDCTWTYDNGTAGFSFHFTLLDVEKNFDYVYVKDGNGTILATYTGTKHGPGFDGPCISTSTGSIQLTSDQSVTGQGFTVDAVNPC